MSHYVTIRFDFSDTSKYASIPLYIGFPATFIPFFIYIQSELSPLVSACSTSGSRYARHPGVGHKKKAYGRNDTGRKQYRNMQRKERQKEKVNTMFKEYFYSLFLCSRPIIHFFEQYIPLVHTYNPLVTNIIYHQQHYTFNFLGFFLHNGAEL